MQKRAIITGATGFLGKFLLKNLVENSYLVYVLIRKSSNRVNIEEFSTHCKCIYYETLVDEGLISALKEESDFDVFIHCGWKGVDDRNNSTQITYNLKLTIDSITLAKKIIVKNG